MLVVCQLLWEWRKIHDQWRSGEGGYLNGGNQCVERLPRGKIRPNGVWVFLLC